VPIEQERLSRLFRCQDRVFAVYRVRLNGRDVHCFGADCPPGFSELTDHPPLVALRLHLGQLIQAEARRELDRPGLGRLRAPEQQQ
jgi:hypothetical protein